MSRPPHQLLVPRCFPSSLLQKKAYLPLQIRQPLFQIHIRDRALIRRRRIEIIHRTSDGMSQRVGRILSDRAGVARLAGAGSSGGQAGAECSVGRVPGFRVCGATTRRERGERSRTAQCARGLAPERPGERQEDCHCCCFLDAPK